MNARSVLMVLALAASAYSRDDKVVMPLTSMLESEQFKDMLGSDIRFEFGDTTIPDGAEDLGPVTVSKKTNAANKSDKDACEWAFLGTMKALKAKAKKAGATAVVGIKSNYDHKPYSSKTEYECHAGNLMAGVALKGILIREKK